MRQQPARRRPARPSPMSLALGEVLRELRSEENLTQAEVGQLAGVTQATIQRLERGLWPTDPATLDEILDKYAYLSNREKVRSVPDVWGAALRRLIEAWVTARSLMDGPTRMDATPGTASGP